MKLTQTLKNFIGSALEEKAKTLKLEMDSISDTTLREALKEKKKDRVYGNPVNFKAEMDLIRWEQAIRYAESPPFYDRWPLHRIYHHAKTDLHLRSQISTAMNKVMEQPYVMINAQGEIDQEGSEALENLPCLLIVMEEILRTEFEGTTLLEFSLDDNGMIVAGSIPRDHINPMLGKVLFYPEVFADKGIPYREAPWNQNLVEIGEAEDLGLMRDLAREAIWKRFGRIDVSRYSEHYGLAWVVGKLATYDSREAAKFMNMIRTGGAMKVLAMDKEDEIEIAHDTRNNPNGLFDSVIERCDREMSKGTNGQTETTESSASSGYAQSKTHMGLLNSYTRARMRRLKKHLNYKVLPLLNEQFGLGLDGLRFDFLRFYLEKQKKYQGEFFGEDDGNANTEKATLSLFDPRFSYTA